jgi:hypothetical protein
LIAAAALSWSGRPSKASYIVTLYARDQFGNVAVSDTVDVNVEMEGNGAVSGSVNLQMDEYQVSVGGEAIMAEVVETDASARIDAMGCFSITGIPEGAYTLRISGPLFSYVTIPSIKVNAGQISTLTPVIINADSLKDAIIAEKNQTIAEKNQTIDDLSLLLSVKDEAMAFMFTKQQLDQVVSAEIRKYDPNGDGKIGFAEIIFYMQVMSGLRAP